MRKLISLLLSITMLFSMTVTIFAADVPNKDYTQTFWDVPKDYWAFNYIAELVDKGVLAGYEDGSFRPDDTVTRAEWAKIMVVGAAINTDNLPIHLALENTVDVSKYDWYAPYVVAAREYMNYYIDNDGAYYFRPNTSASREDVTVSMVKLKGYDINKADYSCLGQFTDVNSISNDLKKYVAVAVEKDLISGFEDSTFRGQASLTRAEAATLLWRAFQYGNDNKVVDTQTTPKQTPNTTVTTPTTTPSPTQAPTVAEPTAAPKQTSKPTPASKPYTVNTLVKADVDKSEYRSIYYGVNTPVYHITSDGVDTIYYLEKGHVYSINIHSKEVADLLDTTTLDDNSDLMSPKAFDVRSICYDIYNNRLLILGNSGLYSLKNNTVQFVTNKYFGDYYPYRILNTTSNGNFIVHTHNTYRDTSNCTMLVDGQSYELLPEPWFGVNIDSIDSRDGVYFINTNGLTKYDFVDSKTVWKPSITIYAVGISQDGFIAADTNTIYYGTLNGELTAKLTSDEYNIIDKTPVNLRNADEKLLLMKDNVIIFYDTSAKAFRMISENE